MLKLFYKQILPFFQKERVIEKIVKDETQLILVTTLHSSINFNKFCEFFANFSFMWTEHTTTASSISFIKTLLKRSMRITVNNIDGSEEVI